MIASACVYAGHAEFPTLPRFPHVLHLLRRKGSQSVDTDPVSRPVEATDPWHV